VYSSPISIYMKSNIVVLFLLVTNVLAGQSITVSVDVIDATCQANGAVTVMASGGSEDFRYTLSNDCGGNFPPQNTPTFTTLVPCEYVIVVEDRQSGEQEALNFTINGSGAALNANVDFTNCDAAILITGGNGPYEVTYTTDDGTVMLTTSDLVIELPPLGDSDVNGTVIDACGNSRGFSGSGTLTAVQSFAIEQRDTGLAILPFGGSAPYTFELQSSFGTFTNMDGVFPWDEVGCNPVLSINSACTGGALSNLGLGLDLRMEWGCVSFADGYAEVIVSPPGRGPYTYTFSANGMDIVQTDSVFTGLPINADVYAVTVEDACGQMALFTLSITRNQFDLLRPATSCTDTEIALWVDRQCTGGLYNPITITCESCPDGQENIQIGQGTDTTFFTGQPIGSWDISMVDNCGDSMRCQDEIILEAIPACDSIVVTLTQQLNCDNGTFSRREILDPTITFDLESAGGTVIETGSATGRFEGVSPGDYLVRAMTDCGNFTTSVTIVDPTTIDPFYDFFPSLVDDGQGNCTMTYDLRLDQFEGPFVLTGGPDGATYEVFNDYDQDNCAFYQNEVTLLPGTYNIKSFSACGDVDFTLPEVEEERIDSVNVLSNCPGASVIEIFALLRTDADYRTWWLDQDIIIGSTFNLSDYITVDGTFYGEETMVTGLAPGPHLVAIIPRFSFGNCPIDTFTFVIPDYEPVTLSVDGDILCDTTGMVPLRLFPGAGNGPYVLREVDCIDPTNILATYPVAIGEAADVPVVTIGTYCFVVEDVCGITADFQVEVRGINGNIDIIYDCAPQLILATDTLPGTFRWLAEDGTVLGSNASVAMVPPTSGTEFTLEVDIGTCILRETVQYMARPFLPALSIVQPASGEVVQCAMDTVVLIAATDTFSMISWDEPFDGDTLVTIMNGMRQVVATNDLGCTTEGEVFVRRVALPLPNIGPSTDHCFGDTLQLGIDDTGLVAINWSSGQTNTDSIEIIGTGFYGVFVTDFEGCSAVDTFTFIEPGLVNYSLQLDSISCFDAMDGTVNVLNLSGGVQPFTFELNGAVFASGEAINGLDIGEYRFLAVDANGCILDTFFVLGQPDSLSVYLIEDQFVKLGAIVNIPIATNADTIANVVWTTSQPLDMLSDDLYRITAITTDSIQVVITDGLGCRATNAFKLTVDRAVAVYVPNAFSPNGDGINDVFVLQGDRAQILNVNSLNVFDRWGKQHFGGTDFGANDFDRGWDGSINGRSAAIGVYVWSAEVMLINGETRLLEGEVTLLR
jgi:gliding motility-associated-like protein